MKIRQLDALFILVLAVMIFGLFVMRSHISTLYDEIANLQKAELQFKQAEKELYAQLSINKGEINALLSSFKIGEGNFSVRFIPVFVTTPEKRGGERFPSVNKAWEKKDAAATEAKR